MKILTSVLVGAFLVSGFVVLDAGCASDSTGEETQTTDTEALTQGQPTPSSGFQRPLKCHEAEDTPNGCLPHWKCCANPVYGRAPICIQGNVCPP